MSCLVGFRIFISCLVFLIIHRSDGFEIIGGEEVEPHSLRYMALLEDTIPVCGGVLIDPRWVLTAAHCDDISKVHLGVHYIKTDENKSRQVRKVKKRFPHPCYDSKEKFNDLMLLKLDKPVKKSKTVDFLKLGKTVRDPRAGSKCLVAGWGETRENIKNPVMTDVLRAVNVTVMDRKECKKRYNGHYYILDSMVCAGSDGKTKADSCQGDSGGPILCNGALVGVTSFGLNCGDLRIPGVYSFLTEKHLKWINDTKEGRYVE